VAYKNPLSLFMIIRKQRSESLQRLKNTKGQNASTPLLQYSITPKSKALEPSNPGPLEPFFGAFYVSTCP
jgi:hypothetical protein